MARAGRPSSLFTFGGRLPWAVGLVLTITVTLSLLVAFGSRHTAPLFEYLSLRPVDVWNGQLWRLVTWPFVEPSPLGLLFMCLFLYWFATALADEWGSERFLTVFGGVALVAGVGTCLVARIDPPVLAESYLGGFAMSSAMIVAWGLWFPDRVVRIWFVLPITGFWIAWLTVAITIVYAVYSGWERFLPELFAEAATLGWLYRRTLGARWNDAQRAIEKRRREAERQARAKKRAKSVSYLHVVEKHDDDPPPLPKEVEDKVRDLLSGPRKPDAE